MSTYPDRLLTLEQLQDRGMSPSTVVRAVRRGALLRVRSGVYAPTAWWSRLGPQEHLRQMHVALFLRAATPPVFGHASAALLHGFHLLHPPSAPHVVAPPGQGSRNNRTCVHHWAELAPEEVVSVDGLLVTSGPRTVVDCAATLPAAEALVIADSALHDGTDLATVLQCLARRRGRPGCRKAARVLDLADGRAESPGETLLRLVLVRTSLPRPELQVVVQTPHGQYRGDLGWRDHRLLLEFDGDVKYFAHGPTDRALVAERKREKDLINAGWRVLRTDWATVTRRPEELIDLVARELARRTPRT